MVDASAEAALSETYRGFAGGGDSFEEIARASKLRLMDNEMASELGALARAAARLARQSPMTADITRAILERAIKAIIACFPVYRTYVDLAGALSEADRRDIAWAVKRARKFELDVLRRRSTSSRACLSGKPNSPAREKSVGPRRCVLQ